MAQETVSIVLVGIGGYGALLLNALLDAEDAGSFRLAGAVDINPDNCPRLADLKKRGVPIHTSLQDFYAVNRCDLAILATPIHLHAPQTCEALGQGSYVLCEKPLGATIQDAQQMVEARDRAGKWVAIGYVWSFARAIQI